MTERCIPLLVGLCFPIVTTVWAQTVTMDPIRVPTLHFDSYAVNGLPAGESPHGWFWFKDGPRSGIFYTNVINLPSRDIRYGDLIRLRTVGTFRKDQPNPNGTNTIGPEVPQPFLGLCFGALRIAGLTYGPYKALSPVATGLPEYATPPYTNLSGTFPTDIPEDFLIPPDGVTLCVPAFGSMLVLLNPDPSNLYGGDPDHDFAVVIEPLEKPRLAVTRTLSSSNVMVGDTFTLTLGMTNYGNVPTEGIHMYTDARLAASGDKEFTYHSNLLERISGPVPEQIASLPPAGSDQITYTFQAIDAGTNMFYARIGRTICDGKRFQQFSYIIGPQVILHPIQTRVEATPARVTVDDEITVVVSAHNVNPNTLTAVQLAGPIAPSASDRVTHGGSVGPTVLPTLASGATAFLTNVYRATNYGQVSFTARTTGTGPNGPALGSTATSGSVVIVPSADLLIRRADETNRTFAGMSEYHSVPVEAQTKRQNVVAGQAALLEVRVANSGANTTDFVLHAVDDNPVGWQFAYKWKGVDITAAIRSPGGWTTPELPPQGFETIRVEMTPVSATTGSEASIRVFVTATTGARDPADLVEARATVQDLVVTTSPADAVVAEYVQVTARYRNPFPDSLSAVRAELRVFGGGGAFPVQDLQPAVIDSLPSGATAEFTQKFAVTNETTLQFVGTLLAFRSDQSPLDVHANSPDLPVGVVKLLGLEPVQVLPGVTIIKDKPTVAQVVLSHSGAGPKRMILELRADEVELDPYAMLVGPGEMSGYATNRFRFFGNHPELVGHIYPQNGVSFLRYPGTSFTNAVTTVSARRLRHRYCYLEFAPKYSLPTVTRAQAQVIQAADEPFLNAVYPMPAEPPMGAPFSLRIDWPERFGLSWPLIMADMNVKARRMGLDRLVVIFPRHPSVWPAIPGVGDASGWAYQRPHPIKHVVAVVGDIAALPGYGGDVSAHEIGHTFGFSDVVHPTVRSVPDGFWPEAFKTIKDRYDLMDYAEPTWINRTHYELLVRDFSRTVLDPDVLLVHGVLEADGAVTAFPWFTASVSDPDLPGGDGTHAVEFRDAQGALLASYAFTPGFEAIGDSFSSERQEGQAAVDLGQAPFSFALPRPPNLASVLVVNGPRMLYERLVTAHAPQIDFIAPQGDEQLVAGDKCLVRWVASDLDGGELTSTLFFSDNGGSEWQVVADLLTGSETEWDVPDQPTLRARLKLQTTDGINTTEKLSPEFSVRGTRSRLLASAGADQFVTTGAPVTLDGSGSHHSGGAPITLNWRGTSVPNGGAMTLDGPATTRPTFRPGIPGTYLFRLTVMDSDGQVAESLTAVYVTDPPLDLQARLLSDGRIEIAWSGSVVGYAIDTRNALDSVSGWEPWSGAPPEQRGGQWVLTVAASDQVKFLRLRSTASAHTARPTHRQGQFPR